MTPSNVFFEMSSGALLFDPDEVVELSALSVIPEGVEPSTGRKRMSKYHM